MMAARPPKRQNDVSEAADAARAAATTQGMNLLIDGTIKSPDKAKKLVEDLVAAGYQVDVVAMCVDPADSSWQGVQNR